VLEFFLGFGNGCFWLGVSFWAKISVFTVKGDVFIGFPCFSSFPFLFVVSRLVSLVSQIIAEFLSLF